MSARAVAVTQLAPTIIARLAFLRILSGQRPVARLFILDPVSPCAPAAGRVFLLDKLFGLYIPSIFIMHAGRPSIVLSQTGGPFYQQIVNQIKQKIAVREWAAGEEIPSIRQLAADLSVSMITVKRAYLELEHAGLIVTQHGKGSFVATDAANGPKIFEREMVGISKRRPASVQRWA
jgi:DNA-binding transcriptional regulator YhcF (GntR family)